METLTIQKVNAVKAYNKADDSGRQILQDLFPDVDLAGKITDRVKSFEDACKILGIDEENVLTQYDTLDEQAYKKLKVIVKALNEGWTPDWDNSNQNKYWPWFDMRGSGLAFFRAVYVYAISSVGSRLCLRSRELVEHAVKHFMNLYEDLFLIKTK